MLQLKQIEHAIQQNGHNPHLRTMQAAVLNFLQVQQRDIDPTQEPKDMASR